jgi:hypothetical protein
MKRIFLAGHLVGFLFLAGCATAKTITGPDGTKNQLISCSTIEFCYDKAREVCGGNYKVVNTNSETSGFNGTTDTEIKLLIKCDR